MSTDDTDRAEALRNAAKAGWNACRRQVYLLSEDYITRTHELKAADTIEGNFYRGQYDVAKSFSKALSAFEAEDCDYFRQIDFAAMRGPRPVDIRIIEFKKCLSTMSHSRAGWDYELPPAQKAKEDREEKAALARARAIWAESPELHDELRAAFKEASPLATMSEIEKSA
jgi:hypothetical protein